MKLYNNTPISDYLLELMVEAACQYVGLDPKDQVVSFGNARSLRPNLRGEMFWQQTTAPGKIPLHTVKNGVPYSNKCNYITLPNMTYIKINSSFRYMIRNFANFNSWNTVATVIFEMFDTVVHELQHVKDFVTKDPDMMYNVKLANTPGRNRGIYMDRPHEIKARQVGAKAHDDVVLKNSDLGKATHEILMSIFDEIYDTVTGE